MDTAFTTMEARDRVIDAAYDLILLDLKLPDGSGLDLLVEWRGEGFTAPVLLLTAKDLLEDKVPCTRFGRKSATGERSGSSTLLCISQSRRPLPVRLRRMSTVSSPEAAPVSGSKRI